MADIKALLADPEFKTLSLEGQKKALARLDPELGGLSDTGYLKFVYQVAPPVGTEKLVGGLPGPVKAPLGRAPMDPFSMDLNQSTPVSTFGGTNEPIGTGGHTPRTMEVLAAPPSTARRNPRTGLPMPPGSGPLKMLDWTPEGTQEAAQGVAQMSDWDAEGTSQTPKPTTANQLLGGGSKVFRGSMKAAAPALLPYGVIAAGPGAMATGLLTGGAAGAGTEAGLNALGVSPEKSAAAGDAASLLFGIGFSKLYGPVKVGYDFITDAYHRAKFDPKLARIIARGFKIPGITKAELIGEIYDHLYPQAPEPKPFSPPVPRVTPQGQGIPGFPKPPGAPEPKVYPAPGVTPQGRGLSGFPKPPVEKPFDPGPAAKPVFKTAPVEKPFNPPVPGVTFKPRTAVEAEPLVPGEAGGVPPAVTELLEKLRAQQPPPREPLVPREGMPGNAPSVPIRPEQTNPAATPLPTQITPPPGAQVVPPDSVITPRNRELPQRYGEHIDDLGVKAALEKDTTIAQHMLNKGITPEQVMAMSEAELNTYIRGAKTKPNGKPAYYDLGKGGYKARTAEVGRQSLSERVRELSTGARIRTLKPEPPE